MRTKWVTVGIALALLGTAFVPSTVWAGEGEDVPPYYEVAAGTIATEAVTDTITIGGITYVPCTACGGGSGQVPMGSVQTSAVTSPLVAGGITYVPQPTCYFCGPWPW